MKLYEELLFNQRGDERGHLVIAEVPANIPFDVKRIFYIYDTKGDVVRGQHANLNSEFVLINLCGKCKVRVDTGKEEKIIDLDHPHKGLYLNKMVWKDMYDFSEDSILLVLSSHVYDSSEYIRDYNKFKEMVEK